MKAKKWLTIITMIITILSLIIASIIGKNSNCIIYDIFMALFGSASLGFIMSLIEYYVERRKAMEEFWLQATKVLKELRKIKYLDIDIPLELVLDAIREEDANERKKKFYICNEENSVAAKEKLISWIEENILASMEKNGDVNNKLEQLYETKMNHYKKILTQCMDSYRVASIVELGNLDNAYGNLDFILANKSIRQESYDFIFEKIRNIVFHFRMQVYHFDLLKEGKGSLPVCSEKIFELNKKYFLLKERDNLGCTNTLIFQNVFDEIDSSLEKFRCKIYKIKYIEPTKIPISERVILKEKSKK